MAKFATREEEWYAYLTGTHPTIQRGRRFFRFLPSGPRCRACFAPFGAPGSAFVRRFGYSPWQKNPNMCRRCLLVLADFDVSGVEIEISMLFADVRGSSRLAREMPMRDFTQLMNRFYTIATDVLIESDAVIEKFVGDEVVGLFLPIMTGPGHAGRAVEAGGRLLRETGHGSPNGPWVPLGAAVHTGTAFVGMVGSGGEAREFTALGESMNTAAHMASQAGIGEILMTEGTAVAATLNVEGLEQRHLSLKGHPVDALVLAIDPAASGSSSAERAT